MKRSIKILTTAALLAAITLSLCGCGEETQQQIQSKQTIQIPEVTVDLQSPENKVQVPAEEPSNVCTGKDRVSSTPAELQLCAQAR